MSISKLELVDASGKAIAASATSAERKVAFPPSGIVNVTKLRWASGGKFHELDLVTRGKKNSWDVLPDLSGLIVTNKEEGVQSKTTVFNADKTIRFELDNPWPQHPNFSRSDRYGFSYPTSENGQPGVVVWVWATSPTRTHVAVEHFYSIDATRGVFLTSHPVR